MTSPPATGCQLTTKTEAEELAKRLLRLSSARSAASVRAHTYRAQAETIVSRIKGGDWQDALETTKAILTSNEEREPRLRMPGAMKELLLELEKSLTPKVKPRVWQ